MAGFAIDKSMKVMYDLLTADGWTMTASTPSEWAREGYEVHFAHRSGHLTIRHRPVVVRGPGESSEAYYDRRRKTPWTGTIEQAYGDDQKAFELWLSMQYMPIATNASMHALSAKAPGE